MAVLLMLSGVWQFFLRPSIAGPALVVSGIAILFDRSWGYYLAYLVAFATLLPPQRTWLIPLPPPIRRALWLYAGMEPELLTVAISVVCVTALGWTHYVLYQSQRLDQPLPETTRGNAAIGALVVSLLAVVVPVLRLVYWLILDPPGPGGPGTPGGGLRAFLVLFRSWPFMLAGVIGIVVCMLILKRNRRRTD